MIFATERILFPLDRKKRSNWIEIVNNCENIIIALIYEELWIIWIFFPIEWIAVKFVRAEISRII